MKFLAIMFFLLLSILWYYFSLDYIQNSAIFAINSGKIDLTTNGLVTAILLGGMFVFGVLFGKILSYKKTSPVEKKVVSPYSSEELNLEYSDSVATANGEIQYSKNSSHTKKGIDTILETPTPYSMSDTSFESVQDTTMLQIANRHRNSRKDTLRIIEGIGPKIQELLYKEGVTSFHKLSTMSPEDIQELLQKGGSKMMLHNPSTWPKQARLADESLFEELTIYQESLIKGREK